MADYDPNYKPHVYLAGATVFEPNATEIAEGYKKHLDSIGMVGEFPLDNQLEYVNPPEHFALNIFVANTDMIDRCDVVLADMTPWHYGPGMDNGTSWEMGYAYHAGKIIVGYSSDTRPFSERVVEFFNKIKQVEPRLAGEFKEENGMLYGPDGKVIERFGQFTDNLMMVGSVLKTGARICGSFEEAAELANTLWQKKARGEVIPPHDAKLVIQADLADGPPSADPTLLQQ